MNKCTNCYTKTKNKKFCSRRCSTIFNNKIRPKKVKIRPKCQICQTDIDPRSKYCFAHNPNSYVDWSKITYKEASGKRKYQKNSRIRNLARTTYLKSDKPKSCKCGYDKHFEVCHIKPISSFDENTLVSEINALDNLIALCPNCHWELDNKEKMKIEKNLNYPKRHYSAKTYTASNKRCCDCNKVISPNATRCKSCVNKRRLKIKWPPVAELLKRIKNEPLYMIGNSLGVSALAIKKYIARNTPEEI